MTLGPMTASRRWALYHVLEHFAAHYGPTRGLQHCLPDDDASNLSETPPGF